ncbi:MAG: AMP-binding protein [Candidatus Nanopelagicales bacterium]
MVSQPWNLHLAKPGRENLQELVQSIKKALAGGQPLMLAPAGGPANDIYLSALQIEKSPIYENTALAICTSGSTGAPKAVEISQGALIKNHELVNKKLAGKANWVLAMNPAFIGGFSLLTRGVIDEGWTYALTETGKFNADTFAKVSLMAAEKNPTIRTSLVWAQLMQLVNSDKLETLKMYDAILVGGSNVESQIFEDLKQAGLKLISTYGMTETCGGVVWDGFALDEVEIRILEKDEFGTGRISINSPTNASGYRNSSELNQETFQDSWINTQDLGQLNSETLTVIGRIDDVVISGGTNVSTKAIEAVISTCRGVEEVAVLALDDEVWGALITAVVVGDFDKKEIEQKVVSTLGNAAKPRVIFDALNMPFLPSGKIDLVKLKELVLNESN